MMVYGKWTKLKLILFIFSVLLIVFAIGCKDKIVNGDDSDPADSTNVLINTGEASTPSGTGKKATPTPKTSSSGTGNTTGENTSGTTAATPKATPAKTPNTNSATTPGPTATPNKYNGNQNFTEGKIVEFSHPSGYYADSFTLTLKFDSSYKVYYTLNGNNPTATGKAYSSSGIKINDQSSDTGKNDNIIVVRAAAFKNGKQVGQTMTASYIINKKYSNFTGRYSNLAVISISTDKTNLWGSNGIFTNFTEHGRESERPAHVEFFDGNGSAGYSIDAGIRVYGGTSRANPQKSLKLVARKEYDPENGKFKYPMIPGSYNVSGKLIDKYNSFILRAGGNDNLFGSTRNTFFRDALVHGLAGKISNIASQAYRPVVVYINGDYYGVYNLRDDLDKDYLEEHYKVPADKVAILAYGHENGSYFYKIDEGTQTDQNNYISMQNWIAGNNMASSANYDKACKMLDMDNFIKYMAINTYVNNRDWPHNNVRIWKYTGTPNSAYGQDGKWRYMLKDIDYSWGLYYAPGQAENVIAEETAHTRNVLQGGADPGDSKISAMFASLMKNPTFKSQFLKFVDQMINNYYSESTASAMINKMRDAMANEYSHIYTNVWYDNIDDPNSGHKVSLTYDKWIKSLDTLYEYARKRPTVYKNLIKSLYG